ncbi:MAG: hypothetical protein KG003_15035 [Bacteroidetes bacterium]|nr:hypothetical protein [Bacteroidota bacterium]
MDKNLNNLQGSEKPEPKYFAISSDSPAKHRRNFLLIMGLSLIVCVATLIFVIRGIKSYEILISSIFVLLSSSGFFTISFYEAIIKRVRKNAD